jgi:hypothetical protein
MATLSLWNPVALEKARAFELAKKLSELLARYYPHLVPQMKKIIDRLLPVRLSHGGRQLRAWGRDFKLKPEETSCIKLLVEAHYQGTKIVELPIESFRENQALIQGTIATDGRGGFWLEEPPEEKNKPILVIFPDIRKKSATKRELALICLMNHPEWSDAQVAEHVGCNRGTLYRCKKYVAAREALESGKGKYQRNG